MHAAVFSTIYFITEAGEQYLYTFERLLRLIGHAARLSYRRYIRMDNLNFITRVFSEYRAVIVAPLTFELHNATTIGGRSTLICGRLRRELSN